MEKDAGVQAPRTLVRRWWHDSSSSSSTLSVSVSDSFSSDVDVAGSDAKPRKIASLVRGRRRAADERSVELRLLEVMGARGKRNGRRCMVVGTLSASSSLSSKEEEEDDDEEEEDGDGEYDDKDKRKGQVPGDDLAEGTWASNAMERAGAAGPTTDLAATSGCARGAAPESAQDPGPCVDWNARPTLLMRFAPPSIPPDRWPQRPLLLRTCPGGGTTIRSVRRSSSRPIGESFDDESGNGMCVPTSGDDAGSRAAPMNTGRESRGSCLVMDFESDLFVGTAMLRIRGAEPFPSSLLSPLSASEGGNDSECRDYFSRRKRNFTAIVRGRFKSPSVPMGRCITGQIFSRPAGKLPPKFVVNGAVKIVSHLAPQLRVDFGGSMKSGGKGPCFLSPLVSTAQTVLVDIPPKQASKEGAFVGANESIEDDLEEPDPSDPRSIRRALSEATGQPLPKSHAGLRGMNSSHSSLVHSRMKARKRAFDHLYSTSSSSSPGPCFDMEKEYTFEFFQHLLVFDEFAVDLGAVAGRHGLAKVLDGQPLKFMAALLTDGEDVGGVSGDEVGDQPIELGSEKLTYLWNFDIWHECLYEDAVQAEQRMTSQ